MKERSCPVGVQEVHAAGLALLSAAYAVLCETELCMLPSSPKVCYINIQRNAKTMQFHKTSCSVLWCVLALSLCPWRRTVAVGAEKGLPL